MVTGITVGGPGTAGWPPYLIAGRQITRGHYEAVADIAAGFKLGDSLQIRRNHYTVVGLTRRMVSSNGDPMVFIPLKDAQEAQRFGRPGRRISGARSAAKNSRSGPMSRTWRARNAAM